MPPIENLKNALMLVIIAAAAHLLVGAFAADESLAAAEHEEAEALSSREFAGRRVCGDRTANWLDDKTIECLKETP
ncbi:hypothetical protein [Paracidovorax wautersii]|uniref:Conjugative transfer region protein TrbK n=1 Tax=Paracidovorax wautersii TaxID=1177982 RepID=A0ABU1II02_9BURK|nr:hypothetical protein [Paracidovorax wautersii]MDR6216218.1 hypothetical protein [Paracidovorax wautersii]